MNSIDWERSKPSESPEDSARRHEARGYCRGYFSMCSDCPPVGYPTDKTRCSDCPRRALPQECSGADQT
jgi:hypothetical protein